MGLVYFVVLLVVVAVVQKRLVVLGSPMWLTTMMK